MFVVTHLNIQHHSLRSDVRCVHETVSRAVVQTSFPLSLQCHVTHKQLNQSQSRNLCHHYNYSHFLLSTRNTCFIFTCPFRNLFTLILGSQFVINHLFLGIKIVFIVKKGSSMRSLIIRFIGRPNAISSCWDFYIVGYNEAAVLIRLITV